MGRRRSDEPEAPKVVNKFTIGSNNGVWKSTSTLYAYADGAFCLQLEDKIGGAEMWFNTAADLVRYASGLLGVAELAKVQEHPGN